MRAARVWRARRPALQLSGITAVGTAQERDDLVAKDPGAMAAIFHDKCMLIFQTLSGEQDRWDRWDCCRRDPRRQSKIAALCFTEGSGPRMPGLDSGPSAMPNRRGGVCGDLVWA